tara:strand:- start:4414 stop:4992 length:579 start_codon:yes stop_codon:yes gene_type:complete
MKFLFQIVLVGLLIIIVFLFYKNYFAEEGIVEIEKTETIVKRPEKKNQNNVIQNLKYNVEIKDNGQYEIKSDFSEVVIENGQEIILMKKVSATFTDKSDKKLYIVADNAEFNSDTFNTLFRDNIEIKYQNDKITSNNLDFDFIKNYILVHQNVMYFSVNGKIKTDNIKIDLVTKNIELFMNEENQNIKLMSF